MVSGLCSLVVDPSLSRTQRINSLSYLLIPLGTQLGRTYIDFQYERMLRFASLLDEFLEVACRGGSKTEDFMVGSFITCIGEPNTSGAWLAGHTKQLERAEEVVRMLLNNTFFAGMAKTAFTSKSRDFRVEFYNGSILDITSLNATSGSRKNLIVLDEGGKATDKNDIRNYMDARGMRKGCSGNVRLRHCTTLNYDSAIHNGDYSIYEVLDGKGLVWRLHVDDCPWVTLTDEDEQMPAWYKNIEFYCKMDAPGGKVFNKIRTFSQLPKSECTLKCLIGIDWNPSWGHAVLVALWDARHNNYYIIDEWRGFAFRPPVEKDDPPITDKSGLSMSEFIKSYQEEWEGDCYTVVEATDAKSEYTNRLIALGCIINKREPWGKREQAARVPLAQGLVENNHIFYHEDCEMVIGQHESFHWDDNIPGKIPRQEDHHLDGMFHFIKKVKKGKSSFKISRRKARI